MSSLGDLLENGISSDGKNVDIFDGTIAANNLLSPFRKVFYLDAENGNDSNNGKSIAKAVKTLSVGYGKLTAGKHDVLVILPSGDSLSITAQFEFTKDFSHIIGANAHTPNSRARISSSGVGANAALKVSCTGSIFANFRLFENTASAGAGALEVTGDRNYFHNIDMQGQAHATAAAGANAYSLKLNGAEENRFDQCLFGLDTVVKSNGRVLFFDGGSARNEFYNCLFKSHSQTVGVAQVGLTDTAGADRYTYFKNCLFYNFWTNHADKLTQVFSIPASSSTHDFILDNCSAVGADEWESNDRGQIWVIGGTPAAGTAGSGGTGIAVEPS